MFKGIANIIGTFDPVAMNEDLNQDEFVFLIDCITDLIAGQSNSLCAFPPALTSMCRGLGIGLDKSVSAPTFISSSFSIILLSCS